jgi:pSer/pThr/pTyr-binding forkhead associated (FHA) protein
MVRLVMRRGPTLGAVYELQDESITIGRGRTNGIIIHDNEVSREHCRLMRVMDDYEVEDLNSSNGTFVNGQRVTRTWLLKPGALVELGDTITLEYERDIVNASTTETETQEAASSEPATEPQPVHIVGIIAGPDTGREYPLTTVTVNIGRDLTNDIVIQDPEVSRFHARLRRTAQGFEIEDLGSTNGTHINKVQLREPTMLQEDDILALGSGVRLKFALQKDRRMFEDNTTLVRPLPVEARSLFDTTTTVDSKTPSPGNMKKRRTTNLGTGLEPGALENHVFLAYAREDWEPIVAELTLSLQDAGLPVWVDQYLAYGGPDWRDAIEQALYECWLMVVVASPRSLASASVKMSYRYFINRDKPLIPFIFEPSPTTPVDLSKRRTIMHDPHDPKRSTHRLIYEIKELRKQVRP